MPQPVSGTAPMAKVPAPGMRSTLLFGLGIFVIAAAMRITLLNDSFFYDELYHILAATSWSENRTLTLYEGVYARAPFYTIFTSWMFDLGGGTNVMLARAPNVIFGALLAAGSAVWTRQVAGPLAGWIVALCVLFWPNGIYLSQVVRFYALHGLVFFAGAIATYDLFRPDASPGRRLLMAILVGITLWFANQLQDSTAVGALCLAIWAGGFVILPLVLRSRQRIIILSLGAVAIMLVGTALIATGTLQELWAGYRTSPWERDPTAYHRVLRETYPLLWPITPILAIFALRSTLRPAGFCLVFVIVGVFVHSFAGVQNIRHIYYFSPFLFALWGMGLQAVLPAMVGHLRNATEVVLGRVGASLATPVILICALLFAMFSNPATIQTLRQIKKGFPAADLDHSLMQSVAEIVAQYRQNGAVIVVTNDLEAVYYFDGFDVTYSQNWLPEMNYTEFARDPRTGRPLISRNDSMRDLVQAYPEGVFLAPRDWWSEWPGHNDITAFLNSFNAPNVDWSIVEAGPVFILEWQTTSPLNSEKSAKIQKLVSGK